MWAAPWAGVTTKEKKNRGGAVRILRLMTMWGQWNQLPQAFGDLMV